MKTNNFNKVIDINFFDIKLNHKFKSNKRRLLINKLTNEEIRDNYVDFICT